MRNFGTGRNLICGGAAAVSLLLLGASGAMADGPRPYVVGVTDVEARTDWTGFYIGGKLGGAWSDISWTQDVNVFTTGAPAGAEVNFSPSGVAGGIIAGGNTQVGHWVFGLELAYSGVNLSQSATSPFFPATDTFSTQIDWIGTIEGRIGYSWDHYLVFGKGGWAGSNAQLTVTRTTGPTATTDEFVDGYTIGGGFEVMTWPSVVLGVEYDYVDLRLGGAPSCPLCGAGIVGGAPADVGGSATLSSVMVRASYLFVPED
jgi:outer membrane immunogenic protein